eukprot:TRINITY_DN1091_c3_g1_i11.p1 TRINITY_DN1091_c3_g1~~TRINITY_DN1091_c3_g1_i11.p1  ORF type:complete len:339 (+),score=81.39 TRINITY_DN1091_c3_g1_i11:3-1019(+)
MPGRQQSVILQEKKSDSSEISSPSWNDFCNLTKGQWGGKYVNYDPTTGKIIPVQNNCWKENVYELSSMTVEESGESEELMRINITGTVDEARWRNKGEEETFRDEKFLKQGQITIYENGSYAIAPDTLESTPTPTPEGEDATPKEKLPVEGEDATPKEKLPVDLEHALNLENGQRVRFVITMLFNKADFEVVRLGVYKEKQVTEKETVKVFDPTWCVNDQESIKKEKYSSELWDSQEIEVLSDGKYKEQQGVYSIQYDPQGEPTEGSGVTYWLPNYCSVTFKEEENGVTSIATFALDSRKNIQMGLETKYDASGVKISTKFISAVSNVRPNEAFVLRV